MISNPPSPPKKNLEKKKFATFLSKKFRFYFFGHFYMRVDRVNLRHRRWMEVNVFTIPTCLYSPHLHVCLFVCEQYYGKTPRRISTKLGGGIRYGPRIMPLDFGLVPKSNMAAMAAILKKYLNFCFCISTCFK